MNPKAILSDADGTLVDTVLLIRHGQYEALKEYMKQMNLASGHMPSYETFEIALNESVGGSAKNTLERTAKLLFHDNLGAISHFDFDTLHNLLDPIQDKLAPSYITAFEGLSDFLFSLGKKQIKLAIFSSGTKHHIVRNFGIALPELGLARLFLDTSQSNDQKFDTFITIFKKHFGLSEFTVVTCEHVEAHKPDPESAQFAMRVLGVTPDECLVLGDHSVDMMSGENAHISTRIGITHGFHGKGFLQKSGATLVVNSLAELKDMLQSTV